VKPRNLDLVMVRRLKSDLRHFGETFPERVVEEIRIAGLPSDAPELVLSRKLAEYGEVIRTGTANLPPREAGYVRLTFVGLQQRLLSSIAAFIANMPSILALVNNKVAGYAIFLSISAWR
jgi:hypothetical protein